MPDLLKVAIRNVGRNKRRTLITVLTIFIGVVVATGTRGLLNGLQGEIRSSLTRKIHGDLQIHKQNYQDSLESSPYKLLIPADVGAIESIYRAGLVDSKGVISHIAPRLRIMALVNHQKTQTTTPVMITGIDSKRELEVCPRLNDAVQSGMMLDSSSERESQQVIDDDLIEAGGLDDLTKNPNVNAKAEGFHQIMFSPSLMRGMGAALGDEVIVLFQDKDNMQQALVTKIVGVVDIGMPGASGRMAWMDIKSLQNSLNIQGLASELALRIPEGVSEEQVRDVLKARLPKDQIVETWLEIAGIFRDAMRLQNAIFNSILVIVFSIVVAAIVNTSLMTVMERTREIGTLMALGYRRKHIMLLFLAEAAVIGASGGGIGILAAAVLVFTLKFRGIAVTLPGQAISTVLFPTVTLSFLVFVLALAIASAVLSGLIPAYRASRMRPVEALASN